MKLFYLHPHAPITGPAVLAGLCLALCSGASAAQPDFNAPVGPITPSSPAVGQAASPVTRLALAPANAQVEKSPSSPVAAPLVNPAATPKAAPEEEQKTLYSFRADN